MSKKLFLPLVLLSIGICFTVGCGNKKRSTPTIIHTEDLLPAGISSWDLSGDVRTGTTEPDLFEVINGGSNIYADHNFTEFAIADYTGSGSLAGGTLACWIFELPNADDTLALYNDSRINTGSPQEVTDIGDEARSNSSFGIYILEFVKDNYYIKLEIQNLSTEEANGQQLLLADHVLGKMPD